MGLDTYLKLEEVPKNIARIIICYDALLQLRQKKVVATNNKYLVVSSFSKKGVSKKLQLDKVLEKTSCEACALGTMLISRARVFNKLKIGNITFNESGLAFNSSFSSNSLATELDKYFDSEQLALIETAFEKFSKGERGRNLRFEPTKEKIAIDFGEKYEDATSRLVAILKNIIANDGLFCPEKLPKNRKKKTIVA